MGLPWLQAAPHSLSLGGFQSYAAERTPKHTSFPALAHMCIRTDQGRHICDPAVTPIGYVLHGGQPRPLYLLASPADELVVKPLRLCQPYGRELAFRALICICLTANNAEHLCTDFIFPEKRHIHSSCPLFHCSWFVSSPFLGTLFVLSRLALSDNLQVFVLNLSVVFCFCFVFVF